MSNDARLFKNWEGFLPPNAVVMGKRIPGETVPPQTDNKRQAHKIHLVLAHALRGETNELLLKILQAMNWSMSNIETSVEGEEVSTAASFTLRLTGGSEVGSVTEKTLTTYSLEEMLSDSKLKREVWSHLKSARFPQ